MIIKKPGQKTGRILDWNVQTTDILPTIAEILNFRLPWNVTGTSVLHHAPVGRTQIKVLNAHKKSEMQFNSVEDAKIQSVQFRINRIGEGLPFDLPQTDSSKRWLGTALSGIQPDLSGKKANINNHQAYMNVGLESDYVPVLVSGSIYFPDKDPQQLTLGIGVNGTIRAITKTFRLNNSHHAFGALIPEENLMNGKNDIQILLLGESKALLLPLAR
jgi:hypothetical protein